MATSGVFTECAAGADPGGIKLKDYIQQWHCVVASGLNFFKKYGMIMPFLTAHVSYYVGLFETEFVLKFDSMINSWVPHYI